MRSDHDAISTVIFGRRPTSARPAPQFSGPQVGVVTEVLPGGVRFTIDAYDGGVRAFGPAVLGQHAPPPVGARVLVVFVGTGIDQSWVLSWT